MSKLTLENINLQLSKQTVLKNVSFYLEEGELFTIIGPSGSGKTSILRVITGAEAPTEGSLYLDEWDITHVPIEKRGIVMVHQGNRLFPHLTVFENVAFPMVMKKKSQEEIEETVGELLGEVGLEGKQAQYPRELSFGQQQRVAVARALAAEPKVLLLDEPFSNLDAQIKGEVRKFLLNIRKRFNLTMLMITHDKEDAILMSDRIGLLVDGELISTDTPKNLSLGNGAPKLQSFIGDFFQVENGKYVFVDKIMDIKGSK